MSSHESEGGKVTWVGDEAHALVGVAVEQNLSGDEIYYTSCLILLVKNMLCSSNIHCMKGFNLILFSYKICVDMKVRASGGGGTRVGDEAHALVGVAVERQLDQPHNLFVRL